jgi:hypothetical protein
MARRGGAANDRGARWLSAALFAFQLTFRMSATRPAERISSTRFRRTNDLINRRVWRSASKFPWCVKPLAACCRCTVSVLGRKVDA